MREPAWDPVHDAIVQADVTGAGPPHVVQPQPRRPLQDTEVRHETLCPRRSSLRRRDAYAIVLDGRVQFTASDGESRVLGPVT
jgi:hypothetical protein